MNKLTESHARQIAQALIRKHKFGWKFDFNNRVNAIGLCDYSKKTIFFSRKYLHVSKEQFRQTILHEIAHALTPGHNHDEVWAAKAAEIGVKTPSTVAKGVTKVKGKWYMHCSPCANTYPKDYHTRHHVIKRRVCHKCSGDLIWVERGQKDD